MVDEKLLYKEVGRAIRDTRIRRKFTQADLASAVSLSRTSINNIEKGRQRFLLHTLYAVGQKLSVEPTELLPTVAATSSRDLEKKIPQGIPTNERVFIRNLVSSSKRSG
jgi:transcriptional regulator with XRE-family HTH domain